MLLGVLSVNELLIFYGPTNSPLLFPLDEWLFMTWGFLKLCWA